jgi:hypothetical protein
MPRSSRFSRAGAQKINMRWRGEKSIAEPSRNVYGLFMICMIVSGAGQAGPGG